VVSPATGDRKSTAQLGFFYKAIQPQTSLAPCKQRNTCGSGGATILTMFGRDGGYWKAWAGLGGSASLIVPGCPSVFRTQPRIARSLSPGLPCSMSSPSVFEDGSKA